MINCKINLRETVFNKKHIKEIDEFFNNIKIRLNKIDVIKNVDFNIIITNFKEMKEISKKYTNEVPKGLFYTKQMVIYIMDTSNFKEMYDTLLHEIGHLIDYILGINKGYNTFYTVKNDISKIIEKDIKYLDYIYANNPQEFFAQSFSECFRDTYCSLFMFDTKKMFSELKVIIN